MISSDELTSLLDRLCVRKITFAGSDCLQLVLRRSDEDRPVGYYKIDSFDFFLFRMLHHRDKGQKKVDWAAQGF